MKDFRRNISRDVRFDDPRYWSFTRDSRIPHGEFGKRRNWDGLVCIVCVVALIVGIIIVNSVPQ